MLNRIRSSMFFTAQSGLATWCRDNMGVRYEQAVHIRQDEPNEEAPINEITDYGDHQMFRCDLPLMDEEHAIDAFNTLSDPNVLGQAMELPEEGGPSWVERHTCDHEYDVRSGCIINQRTEQP